MYERITWHNQDIREAHEESRFKLLADSSIEGGVRRVGDNLNLGSLALTGEYDEKYRNWVSSRQNMPDPLDHEDLL